MDLEEAIKAANDIAQYVIYDKQQVKHVAITDTDETILMMTAAIADKARAVKVLIENHVETELPIIQRSLLELHVYFAFIMQADTDRRAAAYLAHQRLDSAKKTRRVIDEISDRKLAWSVQQEVEADLKRSGTRKSLHDEIVYWSDTYRALFKPGAERSDYREWYNLDLNADAFWKLTKQVGMYDEYLGIYAPYSVAVHGSDATNDVGAGASIAGIVTRVDVQGAVALTTATLLRVTLDVALHYDLMAVPEVKAIFRDFDQN